MSSPLNCTDLPDDLVRAALLWPPVSTWAGIQYHGLHQRDWIPLVGRCYCPACAVGPDPATPGYLDTLACDGERVWLVHRPETGRELRRQQVAEGQRLLAAAVERAAPGVSLRLWSRIHHVDLATWSRWTHATRWSVWRVAGGGEAFWLHLDMAEVARPAGLDEDWTLHAQGEITPAMREALRL